MLSTEKQRPKTAFVDVKTFGNDKFRPKTAVIRPRSVRPPLQKTETLLNKYIDDSDRNIKYQGKIPKACFSATTHRHILGLMETQRPKTAPEFHQIPLDQDLRLPILDKKEYLYLHIPDEGTDSEGEHYIKNRRPRVEIKSNRRILT